MKSANGFVKALDTLMASLEIRSYILVMAIYAVTIGWPHRFSAGKAHELHLGTDGEDCNNGWYGFAMLSSVADDIYAALSKLVFEPKLIVSLLETEVSTT